MQMEKCILEQKNYNQLSKRLFYIKLVYDYCEVRNDDLINFIIKYMLIFSEMMQYK